ncbi:AAA family ATPase, partial [Candidatus Macondimonas diazotrophica]|nr:AAA family ATPase [Candidatus Macondimonas diazotrophica]
MTALSADRPCTDPKDDLFGHAPFARHLAKTIRCHRGGDGLVIALHGPWGSGKTTILNYVCHYLEAEKSEDADPPVVVHFNPWWFSGREDLAQTFLRQLQAALPAKNAKLKRVGDLLGEYGEDIGRAVDLIGVTGGSGRMAGRILEWMFKRRPRDVPALKARIADALREAKVRILVIIDDIDRLDH